VDRRTISHYKQLHNVARKLADIANCDPKKWTVDEDHSGYLFNPIEAYEYAERMVFRDIPRVILTSGSIKPMALVKLNIAPSEFDFLEYEEDTHPYRSPLIYVESTPPIKIDRRSSDYDLQRLVDMIDRTIEIWCEYRGIIHTVNFKLRDYIMLHSRYARYMVTNYAAGAETTADVIARFKAMDPPAILVSPSVGTGYDFPASDARFQIIAKVPFPDETSNIEQERKRLDPNRGAHQAMQLVTQAWGRADRGPGDWQRVMVFDSNFEWFMWRYGAFAPKWFLAHYMKSDKIPEPPGEDGE
jgi:Rad3-related DNA helicase